MQLRSFSRGLFLSYHIKKFGGGRGPKAEDYFLKSVQNDEICRENLKIGVNFFPQSTKVAIAFQPDTSTTK